jgi:hypothetical protein
MTQPNLLELAKQGDAKAIASVMNYLLKDKGITAKAIQKDDTLQVILESAQAPEQTSSVEFIHKLMRKLGIKSIKSVRVYGKQVGQSSLAWMKTLKLTPKLEEPKKQTSSSESSSQSKLKAIADRWPAWFPYPSSWLRTFALVLWMAVILRITGFWSVVLGGVLAAITEHLGLVLSILGLGLLVSILAYSYLHHFLFGKPLPRYPRWLPSPRSLWEGVYAPIVMLLAFVAVLLILVPFLIPTCNYGTVEQIDYCLELTGRELVKYEYRMAQIGGVIWLITASYLYQAEYLTWKRLIPNLNAALRKSQFLRNASRWKSQKLPKKLLIILLIPLVIAGVYLFSKLPEVKETIPVPVASHAPPVTPTPSTPASPATSSPQRDIFGEAVNKAINAATITQSAKSKDDWNLVVSQWQEAIALMKKVPASRSNYTVAQKKAVEYQSNLDYAKQRAAVSPAKPTP